MATVQAAPAVQQLGSVLPQGLSQQAVQEIYMVGLPLTFPIDNPR